MKRVLALILVVMVGVIGCGTAYAKERSEVAETISAYGELMVNAFEDLYNSSGSDAFDDNMVSMTYLYYKLYSVSSELKVKEMAYELGDVNAFGNITDKTSLMLNRALDEMFEEYLDGEQTKDDFLSMLFRVINSRKGAESETE